jgi:hypothetical protein
LWWARLCEEERAEIRKQQQVKLVYLVETEREDKSGWATLHMLETWWSTLMR